MQQRSKDQLMIILPDQGNVGLLFTGKPFLVESVFKENLKKLIKN